MKPLLKRYAPWLPKGWATAFTAYPFGVFIQPGLDSVTEARVLKHESVHWVQQYNWFKAAWYFGLFAWYFAYLFLLPLLWNPFRRKWETEAYLAEGMNAKQIDLILSERPYYLW